MSRTVVDLVAAQSITRPKLADLGLHPLLRGLQPGELGLPFGQ